MAEQADIPVLDDEDVKRPSRWRRFPIKSAIALAVIVLIGLPVFSLLQPRYYDRYEDLGPRMENWRGSTHALIPCSGCHVDPGIDGIVSFTVNSIPAFYSQLLDGPRPENLLTVPGSEACQKCHTSYRSVSSSGDLLMPHKAHVEVLEIDCAVCHVDLVHSEESSGFNSPPMTGCLENCHDGEQASAECLDCHTGKQVPDSHEERDWLETHSARSETEDCGECHAWSPDFCSECHSQRPDSHAGNWKKQHQYPALERGEHPCMTCHDDAFCKECHD